MATFFQLGCYAQRRFKAVMLLLLLGTSAEWAVGETVRDQTVRVTLHDGRVVAGLVDGRTDLDHLWLGSESQGVQLLSRFPWPAIASAEQHGERLEIDQLQKQAVVHLTLEPSIAALEPRQPNTQPHKEWSERDVFPSQVTPLRVQSLDIESRLANWDNDAEIDGLLVTVFPNTAAGVWTAVRGTLDLRLIGEIYPRAEHPHRYPRAGFHVLARASHVVRELDFQYGPATFRLPFQDLDPEVARDIASYGVVEARLGVSGQGVFEASEPFQRLRQASPTRDRLQLLRGQRAIPTHGIRGRLAY
jgi:hypothetical protein